MEESQANNFLEALRTLVANGRYDKAIQGCKALLQQSPGHPGATELLAEAERRKSMFEQKSSGPVSARQFNCPSCGKPLALNVETSQALTCPNCRAVISLEGGEPSAVEGRTARYRPPGSFLKIGLEGDLQGKKVQIIGRLHYTARIREWDEEDNDWWTGDWSWDEWTVVTEDKEYLFIEEDEEGYKIHRKFTPKKAQIPSPDARAVAFDDSGVKYSVLEHGMANLDFFEGEFTWLPELGEIVSYCDTDGPEGTYSIEWRSDTPGGDIAEVEFFSGKAIDKLALMLAFKQQELARAETASRASQSEYNTYSYLAFATSGLLLLIGLFSFSNPTRIVYQHTANYADIPEEGLTVGPFQLGKKGAIYDLRVSGSIPDNTETWGGVELLDAEENSINSVEGDIWRESGSDSEGQWSESETDADRYFRLDSPGVYYARLFVENPKHNWGTLSLSVVEGISLSRYYFIGALIALGFGASMRKFKSANPLWAFIGLLIVGFVILKKMPSSDDD